MQHAALVSQLAGTTRDAKRGDWVLSRSVTVELHDLAGRVVDGPARVDEGAPDALADRTAARMAETADLVVWVVDASMAVAPREVEMGELVGEQVKIVGGLAAGDVIVVSGVQQLREGVTVRRFED